MAKSVRSSVRPANQYPCSIEGCARGQHARGLCRSHYALNYRSGALSAVRRVNTLAAEMVLAETIEIGKRRASRAPDCLIWPFTRDRQGYASIAGHSTILVCRLICEGIYGSAPEGKPLALHNCDRGHEGCIEPTHLEWGSYKKNNVDDKKRAGTFNDVYMSCHRNYHIGSGLKKQRIEMIKKDRERGLIGKVLENRRGLTPTLGSNPSPSANLSMKSTPANHTSSTHRAHIAPATAFDDAIKIATAK